MSSDESDSILPNLQKTRELWSQKSEGFSTEQIMPKAVTSPTKSAPHKAESNGDATGGEIIRFEDKIDDDFNMPDVKSMKSQWETAGPVPAPKVPNSTTTTTKRASQSKQPLVETVPVNREPQEEEEYEVKLGALKEKFEKEAKAAKSRGLLDSSARESVSKAAVDQKKNIFESEIKAQKHYRPTKDTTVDMPAVELSSRRQQFELRKDEKLVVPMSVNSSNHKKQRQISISSDASSQAADVVRHDDPPAQEIKFEIEINSLRKRFEQAAQSNQPERRPKSVRQRKMSDQTSERRKASSESDDVDKIVRSSDPSNDEVVEMESLKDRLASLDNSRYKALTGVSSTSASRKPVPKKRNVEIDIKQDVEDTTNQDQNIVRSPPAGTKEKPDYKASIDLEQARQIFEAASSSPRSGRSSRSSSSRRRSPRSRSTPSPIHRGSLSISSSKSPSPIRTSSRSSVSPSSRQGSPRPRSRSPKKFGDPDVVVLEHTEVNYYYEDNDTRFVSESKRNAPSDNTSEDMSNAEVVKPPPAGTKEEADYVPSVNIRSVRDMFERNKDADTSTRVREPVPKRHAVKKVEAQVVETSESSPEVNKEIIKSTAAGAREEPEFEVSIDLKSARSIFESQKVENYVPRNTIRAREEEAKRQRAAAAAASPRSSESSEASSVEVIRSVDAGSKESPEYQVDLKATKKLFEGGRAPDPIKRETSTARHKREELKGDVVRPEPAGTKEVVEFEKSSDLLSAKSKFQNIGQQSAEEESKRKDPIDIQEEKRQVMQKELEIKEETQLHVEPAAAVVPVRVAIPDDSTEKRESDVAQEYGSYTNVIDYNTEVQHQQPSSDSESEHETTYGKEAPVANGDSAVNGYGDTTSPINTTNAEETSPSEKGAPDANDSVASQPQQEITGKTISEPHNVLDDFVQPQQKPSNADPFDLGNIVGPPQLIAEQNPNDLFGANHVGLGDIVGPPQLDTKQNPIDLFGSNQGGVADVVVAPALNAERNQNDLFGANLELFSTPTPPPRGNKKEKVAVVDPSEESSSSEDDADTPHFNYPYADDSDLPKSENVAPAVNGVDLFSAADISNGGNQDVKATQNSVDLFGFDPFSALDANKSAPDPFLQNSTDGATTGSTDPFDLFASPPSQNSTSTSAKDPFDLFA